VGVSAAATIGDDAGIRECWRAPEVGAVDGDRVGGGSRSPRPATIDGRREVWGKPPDRGDTTPRHEPGTGREQSRNTPLGG